MLLNKQMNFKCCWQTKGIGQFRPLAEAKPYIGDTNIIEQVAEYRVELLCHPEKLEQAIAALRDSHPYEEPAYEAWRLDVVSS